MTETLFIANDATFSLRKQELMRSCSLFATHPELLSTAYSVRSQISTSSLEDFISALYGKLITITELN
jgi:hypothetical protein